MCSCVIFLSPPIRNCNPLRIFEPRIFHFSYLQPSQFFLLNIHESSFAIFVFIVFLEHHCKGSLQSDRISLSFFLWLLSTDGSLISHRGCFFPLFLNCTVGHGSVGLIFVFDYPSVLVGMSGFWQHLMTLSAVSLFSHQPFS